MNFTSVTHFLSSPFYGTGQLKWARLGYFPSPCERLEPGGTEHFPFPGQLGPDNSLRGFPSGQALLRAQYSGLFQNASFHLPPARSPRRFFSSIYCGNLVEFLDVNLTVLWRRGGPCDWVPLEFLTLRVVCAELPIICQLQFRFPYPSTGSLDSFTHESAPLSQNSLYSPVSLILGDSSFPRVLPYGPKNSCFFRVQLFPCC